MHDYNIFGLVLILYIISPSAFVYVCVCLFGNSSKTVRPMSFIFTENMYLIPGGDLNYVSSPYIKDQAY